MKDLLKVLLSFIMYLMIIFTLATIICKDLSMKASSCTEWPWSVILHCNSYGKKIWWPTKWSTVAFASQQSIRGTSDGCILPLAIIWHLATLTPAQLTNVSASLFTGNQLTRVMEKQTFTRQARVTGFRPGEWWMYFGKGPWEDK